MATYNNVKKLLELLLSKEQCNASLDRGCLWKKHVPQARARLDLVLISDIQGQNQFQISNDYKLYVTYSTSFTYLLLQIKLSYTLCSHECILHNGTPFYFSLTDHHLSLRRIPWSREQQPSGLPHSAAASRLPPLRPRIRHGGHTQNGVRPDLKHRETERRTRCWRHTQLWVWSGRDESWVGWGENAVEFLQQ